MPDGNTWSGALGSVIGYLGAEVAEPTLFERLLWPERFYNEISAWQMARMAVMLPMGGPLHKAALETLDLFRKKGLYEGILGGHMLGTAFYKDLKTKYKVHNYYGQDTDDEVRNGLWVTVLRRTSRLQRGYKPSSNQRDTEANGGQKMLRRRTSQFVQHLTLSRLDEGAARGRGYHVFTEEGKFWQRLLAIFASELSAVIVALVMIVHFRSYWFGGYMFFPLVLKFIALPLSLNRERDAPTNKSTDGETVLYTIDDYNHGFPVIEGPDELVRPFFKHWGHPHRDSFSDRARELGNIALVLAFVLFFPAGLLSVLWVSEDNVQILWLSYQMFIIVVMHIMRLFGAEADGRIEDGLARKLVSDGAVVLRTKTQGDILATIERTAVERIAHGREEVQKIVTKHEVKIGIQRRDTADSTFSMMDTTEEKPLRG